MHEYRQNPDIEWHKVWNHKKMPPITSPTIIHKNIFSADNNRKTSLEKSQSFCTKLAPIQDESITPVFTLVKPTRKQKLILPQPEIVLTSPLESPCTEPKKTDFLGIN